MADAGGHLKFPHSLRIQGATMSAETDRHLFFSYAGLLALAVLIIYSGSHGSLPVRWILTLMSWKRP